MSHIYVPSQGPEDWQRLLAKPEMHWRDGYSAKVFVECGEVAKGFPKAMWFCRDRTAADSAKGTPSFFNWAWESKHVF